MLTAPPEMKEAASVGGLTGDRLVSQFYVTDKERAAIATEAVLHRRPITMSGTIGPKLGFFTGVVQSVEEDKNATPMRWRITILDGK